MRRKVLFQLIIPLVCLCTLFLLLNTGGSRQVELLQISVISRYTDGSQWSVTRQGMEQAAEDLNVELRILSVQEGGSADQQVQLLQHEASSGAEAIVLVPASSTGLQSAVADISQSVPIVTMETDMADAGASDCIAVDPVLLGETLAGMAMNGVPQGGTILLLNSSAGPCAVRDTLQAAKTRLEAGGRRTIVCSPAAGESLLGPMTDSLQSHQVDAVIAFEASALEMAAAQSASSPSFPLLYGSGSSAAVAAALEQSYITAIAAQNAYSAGYLAVESAAKAARKGIKETTQPLEFSVVRQETMYEPDNQKLLFPVTR